MTTAVRPSALSLLQSRRFLPIFVTQFLGAFNDNVYKNALIIFLTFHSSELVRSKSALLVTAAAGLFILPFFLFSALAGQFADRLEKSRLIRRIKLLEVVIMALAGVGFWLDSIAFLLFVLFLMGTQSAFFGPLKYSILPQHLERNELITGNGLVQMATFLAILTGTMLGGFLMGVDTRAIGIVTVTVLAFAILGVLSSRTIPSAPSSEPDLMVSWNLVRQTSWTLRHAAEDRLVLVAIVGISWFWFVGATFLQLLPSYTRDALRGDSDVVTLTLTAFSVGIGLGSMLCARLSKGRIETRLIVIGGLGMAVCSLLVPVLGADLATAMGSDELLGVAEFMAVSANQAVVGNLLAVAVFGGLYIVPLFTLVQSRAAPHRRARTIAANNVMNALFMVASALLTLALLGMGWTTSGIIGLCGGLTLTVLIGIWLLCPELLRTDRPSSRPHD